MNTAGLLKHLSRVALFTTALGLATCCVDAHATPAGDGADVPVLDPSTQPTEGLTFQTPAEVRPVEILLESDPLPEILVIGDLQADPALDVEDIQYLDPGVRTPVLLQPEADPVVLETATAVTPEPDSLGLLGTGLAAIVGLVRRRLQNKEF